MHRDYAYGIVDFVTYMELVDFVGGISWEKYYQYIDQLRNIQQQCGANRKHSVFAMYVPSSNSVVFFQ